MADGQDPFREIERLETRFYREVDRRFEELTKKIESMESKLDQTIEKLEGRQYEKSTWTIRQLITILIGFVLGGGALGLIQSIINFLGKGR